MAAITLAQAQAHLDAWLAASLAVASAQSYEIAGRRLTRADADKIQAQIVYWTAQVSLLTSASNGRSRCRTVVPGG